MNILDFLKTIKNEKKLEKGQLFDKNSENLTIEFEEIKLPDSIFGLLKINGFSIKLYNYNNEEERKEIENCKISNRIIYREDSLRCLIYSFTDANEIYKNDTGIINYKIELIKSENISENLDIILINIDQLFDFETIEDNLENTIFENLIKKSTKFKENRLYSLELKNIRSFEDIYRNKIEDKTILDFLRTNLLLINDTYGVKFFQFNKNLFTTESKTEIKGLLSHPKSFNNELLYYLESAQKINFNHIKYLEYYHVIEYFSMKQALKDQEDKLKTLINIYFQSKDYSDIAVLIRDLYESIKNPVDSRYIKKVISKIPYKEIIKLINQNNLIEELKKPYFDASIIFQKAQSAPISEDSLDEKVIEAFRNSIFNRIYKIRNMIVHSSTKDADDNARFNPTEENLQKLEADLKLIKIIAYQVAKIESN